VSISSPLNIGDLFLALLVDLANTRILQYKPPEEAIWSVARVGGFEFEVRLKSV